MNVSAIEQWFQYSYITSLSELHEIDFTLTELQIYLNRNPDDEMAMLQLEQLTEKRERLAQELEAKYRGFQPPDAEAEKETAG